MYFIIFNNNSMLAFTLALQFRANVTILILSRWTKYTENNAS